jgi:hypothetical protein
MITYNENRLYKVLRSSQKDLLYKYLPHVMDSIGRKDYDISRDCLFVHGNVPVMLCCHLDTVGNVHVKNIVSENGTLRNAENQLLGADDRCGVYGLIELSIALGKKGIKPYLAFFTDEEIGLIGADNFIKKNPYNLYDIKFCIELDRRGKDDCVFYEADYCEEFIQYVESKGFKYNSGSCSDISCIIETWKIPCVNLSIGYYNEHTPREYLVIDEMMSTINKVYNWLLNVENEKIDFQFIEIPKLKYRKSLLSYSYSPQEEDDETLLNEEGVIEYNGSKWFICSDCGTLISEDEYYLTMKSFGVALCGACADYYNSYIDNYHRSYSIEEKYDEEELEAWLDYVYGERD